MTVRELRAKYLAFFQSKGHLVHASGSLVPYWVTGELDESLLFNGAGMVQFKPYFRGVAEPPSRRLATCQKCLRTGDIESVGDASHLTFFEMLGNFSFGDYFKQDAIAYSWEFLTSPEWLGLNPRRLAFTVFSEDDEAEAQWSGLIASTGIDPKTRVFRLGEETNYWPAGSFSSGPPGPCGPNSEMFYWGQGEPPEGPYTGADFLRDDEAGRWLEIWNDVFISYEWQGELNDPLRPDKGWRKTGMPDLPFKSIDTGMGLERTAVVLAGLSSVYDTDAFQPILARLEELGGGRFACGQTDEATQAMRVVADHLRASVMCICDGVLPGSTGRGYVLRRLIRRAVLKGQRVLGFEAPFLAEAADAVIENLVSAYPELAERRALVLERLAAEEAQFRRTLDQGVDVFGGIVASLGDEQRAIGLPGERAFFLYDTFGFPLEVTQELAAEQGLAVDLDGYRSAMAEAQERSRGAGGQDDVYGGVKAAAYADWEPTLFLGYTQSSSDAVVLSAQEADGRAVLVLDQSPFYAESGGQVGDTGVVRGGDFAFHVQETRKQGGVWVHSGKLEGGAPASGAPVKAEVDMARRTEVVRNHTATHLLHAALRKVLGAHVAQQGSFVGPEQLRFDFSHGSAMSPAELDEVESIVNEHVLAAQGVVTYEDVPLAEARAMGAMALFGEKYADRVRVVQIGDMAPGEASFSRELCGGIHVRNTGQIGLFKIVGEGSAAGGVRRVTAVTGEGARRWALEQQRLLAEAGAKLKTNPLELSAAIDRLQEALKEEKRKREKMAVGASSSVAAVQVGRIALKSGALGDVDAADAQRKADQLVDPDPLAVAVLAAEGGGRLTFVVKAGPEAVAAGVHAGNLAREVAKVTGGGGGGRPNFATAGGKDLDKRDEALAAAEGLVRAMTGG